MKCTCTQGRDLVQTGYGPPTADLRCPVCPRVYFSHDGGVTTERPAVWPAKKDESIKTWELKGGYWKIV